jgi:hypothetical protein
MITEANVKSLDLANGGGHGGRLAGSPPQFRPVGSYEAGRAPIFAMGNNGGGPGSLDSPPRRGGLFRAFFGR